MVLAHTYTYTHAQSMYSSVCNGKKFEQFCICGVNLSEAPNRGINHSRSTICESLSTRCRDEYLLTRPFQYPAKLSIYLFSLCNAAIIYMSLEHSAVEELMIHSDILDMA